MKKYNTGLALFAIFACTLPDGAFAKGGIDPEVFNVANDGGRLQALSDGAKPQRLNYSNDSIWTPIENSARLILHFYPERLDMPGKSAFGQGNAETSTAVFAKALFRDEWVADMRAATDPFARRELEQRWYKRLKNMEMKPRTTIQMFWSVTLDPSRYDFSKETFPVYASGSGVVSTKTLPSPGPIRGFNCIKLDRTFDLTSVKIPRDEAEAFIARNQNNANKGSSAAIFVGMRVTVTGRNNDLAGDRSGCGLLARVESIKGFDYVMSTVSPGAQFRTWYERSDEVGVVSESNVATPFHAQDTPVDAQQEAREFRLKTIKGRVLIGPGQAPGQTPLLTDPLAIDNFASYVDFLYMGAAPELFTLPTRAQCTGNEYLSSDQRGRYFATPTGGRWLGNDEFEIKRNQQAFIDNALPQILKRAVSLPRRLIIVAKIQMPDYDFQNNGFQINALNRSAQSYGFHGRCSPASKDLGSGDYIDGFWSLPPDEAEAVLLSLSADASRPGAYNRTVFLASEVELNMLPALERSPGHLSTAFVPVIVRLISSTLYADLALSKKLYSPRIYKTKRSVLEAGLPASVKISKSHAIDLGSAPDYLKILKTEGELSARDWTNLAGQQMQRDEAYITEAQSQQRDPGATLVLDEDYTPFFPWRYPVGYYEVWTSEQRALFEQWSRMQAAALP